ncbi:MAG: twin-arginine translocase subunit TatC [Acidimicrobiaceae bacterium]|nr:twin-arginine translocase subunit TatC [Acidimicrobiaceae bacterium]
MLIGVVVVVLAWEWVFDLLTGPYADLCERRGPDYCGDAYDPATGDVRLNILDPVEGLATRLRVGFYGGLIIGAPVVLWQLWRFIVPALHKNERKHAIGFVVSSCALFALGGFIAFTTLERALEFLIDWAGEDVDQVFQVQAYIRLVTLMVVAFGVGFTIPVLLVFLQLLGVLSWRTLLKAWRYAIVGTFVIAAAITPSGDPISLLALSGPMVLLYLLAVLIGRLVQGKHPE